MNCNMALTDATGKLVNSYHNSADVAGDWHQFAHQAKDNPLNQAHLVSLNKWVVTDVFGRFLQQLDVEEADGKTFLDNSLVLMGGELSMDHYVISQPTLFAGGAGGAIKTGYYVDYSQMTNKYANAGLLPWGVLIPGLPYNRLYVTILQAMGLAPGRLRACRKAGLWPHRHVRRPLQLAGRRLRHDAKSELRFPASTWAELLEDDVINPDLKRRRAHAETDFGNVGGVEGACVAEGAKRHAELLPGGRRMKSHGVFGLAGVVLHRDECGDVDVGVGHRLERESLERRQVVASWIGPRTYPERSRTGTSRALQRHRSLALRIEGVRLKNERVRVLLLPVLVAHRHGNRLYAAGASLVPPVAPPPAEAAEIRAFGPNALPVVGVLPFCHRRESVELWWRCSFAGR